ncbi:MAG: O-antigen ligase family protein [Deltaproteobacteria bacterium]|nr:MAG: O-antigen ligase family protein [Deltaproteobacteria bacterium]
MFAIPGIAALIVFILARPQEFFPLLQRVPFLHVFTVLAVLGYVIDVRLRRLQPVATPTLPWVAGFFIWTIIDTAVLRSDLLLPRILEMVSVFALYGTIAHAVQRFRTFQLVVGVLTATTMFITLVCFHQGLADMQCVAGEESAGDIMGKPDGRPCETNEQCRGPDAEPGFEYRCERIGIVGTYSVEERVRYRGELHDPNEVALAISAGALSMLLAFAIRKRKPHSVFFYGVGAGIAFYTVFMTQSRGGLVAGLLVPGIYIVRRWGLKSAIPAVIVALPVLMLGGRSGESADQSTQERYEAWATGLTMFKGNPIFGVGARQFAEHHYLTAHNTFVLCMGELGFPGLLLFIAILYLSFKSLIVGLRELRHVPGSEVATTWGLALLASMAGIVFQINTLSFAYHSVMWIFFALVGAWCSAVQYHMPSFRVRMTWRDFFIVVGLTLGFIFVILPLFLRSKGY